MGIKDLVMSASSEACNQRMLDARKPSVATASQWRLQSQLDGAAYWMLRYIRRGQADQAAAKARVVATFGQQILLKMAGLD